MKFFNTTIKWVIMALTVLTCSHLAIGQGSVYLSGSTWNATVNGNNVYSGSRMFDAVNAACSNMGSGTIDIWNSGNSGNDNGGSSVYAIRPLANQTLDFHGNTVNCNSSGDLITVVYADRRNGITVRNLHITGNPRYAIWFRGCSDMTFTDITMNLSNDSPVGLGIRVDASTGASNNLTINGNININGSAGHAIETYTVGGVNIGDVTVTNTGGCGVLLNDSWDCNVGVVTGDRNNQGGGYATFRVANENENTYCAGVYSRNSGRGFFSVSGSRDCTVEWVDIANTTSHGIFLEDATNTHVLHGTVSNGNPDTQEVRTTNCSINLDGQTGGGGCDPTSLTPYVQVNGGSWQQSTNVTITSGDEVKFGPQPNSGGSWSWNGCGTSGSSREQTIYPTSSCTATATYTNSCGAQSSLAYNITVNGTGGGNNNTITIQENGSGYCDVDGSVDSNNSGYTGSGFANTDNSNGTGIDWAINGGSGDYTFRWRFANGSSTNRTGVLYINGNAVSTEDFAGTGGWTTWTTTSVTISNVSSGNKTIRLEANQGSGLANIDYLEVTGPSVSSGSCDGGSTEPTYYTLSTNTNGSGSVSGGGTYEEGSVVTLTASPSSGWQFDSWSGAASGSNPTTSVTVNSNITVTANFSEVVAQPVTITLQENASGFCSVDGSVDNNNGGFTGTGFANTANSNGNGVNWSIDGAAGDYTLRWRFANGSSTNRTGVVYINGSAVSTEDFAGTGSWTTWTTTSVTLSNIAGGVKSIRLEANQGSGLANIDYLEVTGPGVSASGCSGAKQVSSGQAELESDLATIQFYPNPTADFIQLELPQFTGTESVRILNIMGQEMIRAQVRDQSQRIDIRQLTPGQYILQISVDRQMVQRKIIKR